MNMWDFEQFCSTSNIFQVRRIVLWVERGRYRKECQYYSVRSTLWSDVRYCQILSDIVRYCQILSLFIVQVWWAGTPWAVNNNLKTSSGLWRAEGWLLTSWKRIWNQAILDQEYLSQKFKWTNVLNANLSDFLGNLFRFSGQFIQICSWAEKSREIGAGGGSQGKEQCE